MSKFLQTWLTKLKLAFSQSTRLVYHSYNTIPILTGALYFLGGQEKVLLFPVIQLTHDQNRKYFWDLCVLGHQFSTNFQSI